MNSFAVGDRVRIKNPGSGYFDAIGTVDFIREIASLPIYVRLDDPTRGSAEPVPFGVAEVSMVHPKLEKGVHPDDE